MSGRSLFILSGFVALYGQAPPPVAHSTDLGVPLEERPLGGVGIHLVRS